MRRRDRALQISRSPASPRRCPIRGPSRRATLGPAITVFRGSRNNSLPRSGASRQRPGRTKAFGLAAVRRFAQRRPQYPTGALRTSHRSFQSPIIDISKIPCKFPANSLLPQKNSLLGIQKFPAPLRREFGNRGKAGGRQAVAQRCLISCGRYGISGWFGTVSREPR